MLSIDPHTATISKIDKISCAPDVDEGAGAEFSDVTFELSSRQHEASFLFVTL